MIHDLNTALAMEFKDKIPLSFSGFVSRGEQLMNFRMKIIAFAEASPLGWKAANEYASLLTNSSDGDLKKQEEAEKRARRRSRRRQRGPRRGGTAASRRRGKGLEDCHQGQSRRRRTRRRRGTSTGAARRGTYPSTATSRTMTRTGGGSRRRSLPRGGERRRF